MIDKALTVLTESIRDYLIRLPELNITNQDAIDLSHILNYENGELAIPDNTIGVTLVNIEEERVVKSQKAYTTAYDGSIVYCNPNIKLNLFVLLIANFGDYKTGLQYLSGVIRYFQYKNVFTSENTPTLDVGIEKLIVELYSMNFEQQNNLWSSLGAKYMPSVLYRVRMLTIQEALTSEIASPIEKEVIHSESI